MFKKQNKLSSSKPKVYDIIVVGSGIACSYTIINYIERLKSHLPAKTIKIAVLDKYGEFWSGIPYGSRSGRQSLIITALKEFLPQPEREVFISWLAANYTLIFHTLEQRPGILSREWLLSYEKSMLQGDWDELFIPRYIFGLYIKDRVEKLLEEAQEEAYLQCNLFAADVTNIQKLDDIYQIEYSDQVKDESHILGQKVILAIGSPPNKIGFLDQFDVSEQSNRTNNNFCFVANMYESSQDDNVERIFKYLKQSDDNRDNRVLIIGSNASALETLYSLNDVPEAQDLISKFIVLSPNAQFPHRIDNKPVSTTFIPYHLTSLVKGQNFTAEQILEAVKQDVNFALENNETVNSTYTIISKSVIDALNKLSFAEQKLFVTKYGVEIGKYQRRAGSDYLDVVEKLIFEGKLEFLKGKFVRTISLASGGTGFEFTISNGESKQKYTSPIAVVINCAGFQDLTRSSSPLIKNLVQQKICIPNNSKCGFEMNENFEANENFYLMGPLVAGNINNKLKVWHAESCGRIIKLSQQLAEILV
ncbi:FAD/NAD(P)-binding protein [Pleurocapsa sp. PCC 7319]|uniref:FAD/NAD(P)-binding protein n=1 Tax=Pleurocapsa sp. PCC 7319 TaxID=118161 RepID=UPI0003713DFF|nr:FAD/NAD(P)-binding protein [Pleurocapsa sp. PCC 7319]